MAQANNKLRLDHFRLWGMGLTVGQGAGHPLEEIGTGRRT